MNESSDGEIQQSVIVDVETPAKDTNESENENQPITGHDSIVEAINDEISENFRFLDDELIRNDVDFPSTSSSLIDDNNNQLQLIRYLYRICDFLFCKTRT